MSNQRSARIIETGGPPESEAGGILTIDLAALAANWRELGVRAAAAECAAVVKADGYGCGIEPVSAALAKAGCKTFFVADLSEGRSVRRTAPPAAVYVLNGLAPGSAEAFAQADLRESGSIEQDADVVLFLFREEYYLKNKEPRAGTEEHFKWQSEMDAVHGKAEIIIGKQRHGPTGTVQLQFKADVTRFSNLAQEDRLPIHF